MRSSGLTRSRGHRRATVDRLEPRCLFAADFVISEFLASNSTSYANKADWIEVYNRGDATGSLAGYSLTDTQGQALWTFPAQTLAAGGRVVVWATDVDKHVVGQQLECNFKLGASGEYLALLNPDGTVKQEFSPTFPAQTANISYGLSNEADPASAYQYFNTPTPGTINLPSAIAPTYTPLAKVFTGSLTITLTGPSVTATSVAKIYYTLDRSAPTTSSPIYDPNNKPTIIGTTMVRSRVIGDSSILPSPIVSQTYVAIDASVANVDSNLGLVVVDTFNTTISDVTANLASATFINNTVAGRAHLTDAADYQGRIGFRIRGSTSENYPKKQFAVELWDEANNDKKVSLLGLPAESDWVLYAPYAERSLMQNALVYTWGAELGRYAPRVKFVELYLNSNGESSINSADYWGIYMLTEKIKASDVRVDVAKLTTSATDDDFAGTNITGGYLWKKDRFDTDEVKITTNGGQTFGMVDPATLTTNQTTYLKGYLNDFETALNGANYKSPTDGYAKYIDVDSWVDHYLLAEMAKNVDAFWLSTFYAKDRNGKIQMIPEWDYNLSLGNIYYSRGNDAGGFLHDLLTTTQYPYFPRLFTDPAFKQKVTDRWAQLRKTVFSTSQLMADIDGRVAELTDNTQNYPIGASPLQTSNNAVVRNFKKWPILGTFVWPVGYYDVQGRWIEDVKYMKNWLTARTAWLDSQYLPAPTSSLPSGYQTAPQQVALAPQRVNNNETTLISAASPKSALIAASQLTGWNAISYDTAGWQTGTGGVGYDNTTTPADFNPLIGTGLNTSAMLNSRSDVYVRVPFTIADPAAIDSLILKLRYDDGFLAYLNGTRIAGNNEPLSDSSIYPSNPYNVAYNAVSSVSRVDASAIVPEEFDVSAWKNLLVAGTNVLAFQAINSGTGSNDLLLLPELVSRSRVGAAAGAGDTATYYTLDGTDPLLIQSTGTLGPSASAILYSGPVSVSTTTRIRSRSVRAGAWSAIAENYSAYQPDALRVSEIMYHPAAPVSGAFGTEDFEYLEVTNTTAAPLRLYGYAFTDGIMFSFPDVTLPAGGAGVIVKNLAAFQARYGTSITPLGVYTGSLDNGGETVTLTNPFAATAQTFTYADSWYASTDGPGASLEVNGSPQTLNLNVITSWRASPFVDGTPGVIDLVAPTVSATAYAFDTATNKITIAFSENVLASLGTNDVFIQNLVSGQTLAATAFAYDPSTNTATFTLAGALLDSNYRVSLPAGGIFDTVGNPLPQSGFDFFILAADADRNRTVDTVDFAKLVANFGAASPTFSQGNFNNDSAIDSIDFGILVSQYGKMLSSSGALPLATKNVASPTSGQYDDAWLNFI